MQLKFSKQLTFDDNTVVFTPAGQLRLYSLTDDNGLALGQFFHYPDKQFLEFDDRHISIEKNSKWFSKPGFLLIEKSETIGECQIYGGEINHFWKDVPSDPNATIKLGEQLFNFRRIATGIKTNFFKPVTWGHFKFRLYTVKGHDYAEYNLKMDIPAFSKPNFTNYRPFNGTIETNIRNLLPVLAGFHFMEFTFTYEDQKLNG